MMKKMLRRNFVTFSRPVHLDVISALTNSSTILTLGKLWKGDAPEANRDLEGFSVKRSLQLGVIECANMLLIMKDRIVWPYLLLMFMEQMYVLTLTLVQHQTFSYHKLYEGFLKTKETDKIVTVPNIGNSGFMNSGYRFPGYAE